MRRLNSFDRGTALTPQTRRHAVEALRGFASAENSLAWEIASDESASDEDLAFAVVLARDASIATHGLDFAVLDTYGLALSKSRRDDAAGVVGQRVLDVCDALAQTCSQERLRAEQFVMFGE